MSLISKRGNPTSVESALRIFAVVGTLSRLTLHICMHYHFKLYREVNTSTILMSMT